MAAPRSKAQGAAAGGPASEAVRAQAMATRQETAQHLRAAVAMTSATEELGAQTLS